MQHAKIGECCGCRSSDPIRTVLTCIFGSEFLVGRFSAESMLTVSGGMVARI